MVVVNAKHKCGWSINPAASLIDVRINIAGRSALTCVFPVQRSVRPSVDNCFRDQAVTNAKQLADLLSRNDLIGVVKPA
jgi:hypothetical protein